MQCTIAGMMVALRQRILLKPKGPITLSASHMISQPRRVQTYPASYLEAYAILTIGCHAYTLTDVYTHIPLLQCPYTFSHACIHRCDVGVAISTQSSI